MGLFSTSSPLDQYVEQATSENNTTDDWTKIMDICDKIKESSTGHVDGLKSITKRLKHDNPRVVLQAITLLDSCINNCGRRFHLKVSEREFEQELSKLLTSRHTHMKVKAKLREAVKMWAQGEFKSDPQLGLIPALFVKLQHDGHIFESHGEAPPKKKQYSNDPNVVNDQQEEDDIARAIQLSLQDSGSNSLKTKATNNKPDSSLYAQASAVLSDFSTTTSTVPEKEPQKVRALYDFEAAEDNELTFKAGEIVFVLDNSDANWWKGSNHRGEGLFPSNFVTDNLEDVDEPSTELDSNATKKVSFSESVQVTEVTDDTFPEVTGEVDVEKVDQLLHVLHDADPTGVMGDDSSLPALEDQVNAMAPTIDAELEQIDRRHAQLARLSTDLGEALNLYQRLMREMPPSMPYYTPYNTPMQPPMSNQQYIPTADLPPSYMSLNMAQGMHHMYPGPNQPPSYMAHPGPVDPAYMQPAAPVQAPVESFAPMHPGTDPMQQAVPTQAGPESMPMSPHAVPPASSAGMMPGGYPMYPVYRPHAEQHPSVYTQAPMMPPHAGAPPTSMHMPVQMPMGGMPPQMVAPHPGMPSQGPQMVPPPTTQGVHPGVSHQNQPPVVQGSYLPHHMPPMSDGGNPAGVPFYPQTMQQPLM